MCPVQLTIRYFDYLGANWVGSVIPGCLPSNSNAPHPWKIQNYTSAQEDLAFVMRAIGEDPSGYSQQSMKRGGATEAANRGAGVAEIQVAGNWSNARTASRYIDGAQHRNQVLRPYLE